MTRWLLGAAVFATATGLATAGTAQAVTPVDGGAAGGTTLTINDGPGIQLEPRVSGNLATYSDLDTFRIHYYDFLTGVDSAIPAPFGTVDTQADVDAGRIGFIRGVNGVRRMDVYDTATAVLTEIDPGVAYDPFVPAIGDATVAFEDDSTGNGDIMVADLAAPTAPLTNISASPAMDGYPHMAPSGDLVVWQRCDSHFICDIYRSLRTGATWSAATPVLVAPQSDEVNPDTDGTVVVYDSDRPSAADNDIYVAPAGGGDETHLHLPGIQRSARVSDGVVAFESTGPSGTRPDISIVVLATNTMYRVTDTPGVQEFLDDVTVLPNGDVRVVWDAGDFPFESDIYARTFSLPLSDPTPPAISHTVTGTRGDNGWFTTDVDLTWQVSEPESPATLAKTGCIDRSITADQPAATYSCSASSAGGSAGPDDVTLKRDATPPTVTLTGNAGRYTVAQTVRIGCTATDSLSGIATGCNGVTAPAYKAGLGTSTVTRTATDNAGNVGSASAGFTVVVDPASLCDLTTQLVQDSQAYKALSPAAQRSVDASLGAACAILSRLARTLSPTEKAGFVRAYKDAIKLLAHAGWLTGAQANLLAAFADSL